MMPDKDHQPIFRTAPVPRQGWAEAFGAMAAEGDDRELDVMRTLPNEWDQTEWEW